MSISDTVSWYALIILLGKRETDNFLCWQQIFYVQDAACGEVLGRIAAPQSENIRKNNACLGSIC